MYHETASLNILKIEPLLIIPYKVVKKQITSNCLTI